MVKRICLVVVCVFFFSLTSQSQNVDSLKEVIKNSAGVDKYQPLVALARAYALNRSDNGSGLVYAKESLIIAQQARDSAEIANSSRMVGVLLNRMNEPKLAEEFLLRALTTINRNKFRTDYLNMMNILAIAETELAKYDKALHTNFQVLAAHAHDGNNEGISVALNNIGFVYYKLVDYSKALGYFTKCVQVTNTVPGQPFLDHLLCNISLCYAFTHRFEEAKKFVDESLKVCGSDCSDRLLIETSYSSGIIYFGLKEFNAAESYFRKSYDLSRANNYTRLQLDNIDYLSQIYLRQNKMNEAIEYLTVAEQLINEGSPFNLELIKIYSRFIGVYRKTKDYARLSAYQKKYIDLRDSVFNEELTLSLMRTEAEFHERENLARIASQDQILVLKEKVIERQKLLKVFIGVTVLALILLAGVLIWNNRQKQLIRNALDIKVRERTDTLERSYRSLMLVKKEREALFRHTSVDINGSLSTITGLCNLGLKDISDPQSLQYISELSKVSNDLIFYAKKFQTLDSQYKKSL